MYSERINTRTVPMPKMDTQLSSYWVKFFKNAGFPVDVATKHAVVFSNNRIRPDMLPDLDKPSLKEMGITLMGDMIAILRYAKKVVEETTCKNFLDAEDSNLKTVSKTSSSIVKPVVKKVVSKAPLKSTAIKTKMQSVGKVVSNNPAAKKVTKPIVALKKPVKLSTIGDIPSKMYSDYMDSSNDQYPTKRKYVDDYLEDEDLQEEEEDDDNVLIWSNSPVPAPKRMRSSEMSKKVVSIHEPKKNVFNRLGDSMVSSTTNSYDSFESKNSTTFNVTGVRNSYPYSSSSSRADQGVFKRLGNKEFTEQIPTQKINGSSNGPTQGILKTRKPMLGTKVFAINTASSIPSYGTMRADQEASLRLPVERTKPMVRNSDKGYTNFAVMKANNNSGKNFTTGKLASDSMTLPAKSRLGGVKQVTFDNVTQVAHFKKPDVFSRLGL